MGLDLWFREDVARILAATHRTMQAAQAAGSANPAYQQGFIDALSAVAAAFGIDQPSSTHPRPEPFTIDIPQNRRRLP